MYKMIRVQPIFAELELSSTKTIRVALSAFDISYDGDTYTSDKTLVRVGPTKKVLEFENTPMEITLNAHFNSDVLDAINNFTYRYNSAKIYKGDWDDTTHSVTNVELIKGGFLDTHSDPSIDGEVIFLINGDSALAARGRDDTTAQVKHNNRLKEGVYGEANKTVIDTVFQNTGKDFSAIILGATRADSYRTQIGGAQPCSRSDHWWNDEPIFSTTNIEATSGVRLGNVGESFHIPVAFGKAKINYGMLDARNPTESQVHSAYGSDWGNAIDLVTDATKYLTIEVVIGHGPMDSVQMFSDHSDETFNVLTASGGDKQTTYIRSGGGKVAAITVLRGTEDQVGFGANNIPWRPDALGKGLCIAQITMLASPIWADGIPNFTFIPDSTRIRALTSSGFATTRTKTNKVGEVFADFLTSGPYGLNLEDSVIGKSFFEANTANRDLIDPIYPTHLRGSVTGPGSYLSFIQKMSDSCGMKLYEKEGKLELFFGTLITDEDIVKTFYGESEKERSNCVIKQDNTRVREIPNEITGRYYAIYDETDKTPENIQQSAVVFDEGAYLEDNKVKSNLSLSLDFLTTDGANGVTDSVGLNVVKEILNLELEKNRLGAQSVIISTTYDQMGNVELGKVVVANEPRLGWTGENVRRFRVVEIEDDNLGRITIKAIRFSNKTYGGIDSFPNTSAEESSPTNSAYNTTLDNFNVASSGVTYVGAISEVTTEGVTYFVEEYSAQFRLIDGSPQRLVSATSIRYASVVSNYDINGNVTTDSDVVGYSELPFTAALEAQAWIGELRFLTPDPSEEPTAYSWRNAQGPEGPQGRQRIAIYRAAATQPATPSNTDGSYENNILTPPTDWYTINNIPTPGVGESLWICYAYVDPNGGQPAYSELTELDSNGLTGEFTDFPALPERGYFDIYGSSAGTDLPIQSEITDITPNGQTGRTVTTGSSKEITTATAGSGNTGIVTGVAATNANETFTIAGIQSGDGTILTPEEAEVQALDYAGTRSNVIGGGDVASNEMLKVELSDAFSVSDGSPVAGTYVVDSTLALDTAADSSAYTFPTGSSLYTDSSTATDALGSQIYLSIQYGTTLTAIYFLGNLQQLGFTDSGSARPRVELVEAAGALIGSTNKYYIPVGQGDSDGGFRNDFSPLGISYDSATRTFSFVIIKDLGYDNDDNISISLLPRNPSVATNTITAGADASKRVDILSGTIASLSTSTDGGSTTVGGTFTASSTNPTTRVQLTTSSLSFDPDIADTVYSSNIPNVLFPHGCDQTQAFSVIGNTLSSMESDITYNNIIHTGSAIEYIDVTYKIDGIDDVRSITYAGLNTKTQSFDGDSASTIEEARDLVYDAFVLVNADPSVDDVFTITKVGTDSIRVVGDNSNDASYVALSFADTSFNHLRTQTISGGELANDSFGVQIKQPTKYININMGTSTNIEVSMTISGGFGHTSVTPTLTATDPTIGAAPHTTYTVRDYDNGEVTVFTGSVEDASSTDLSTVNTTIINAINSNTENPIDFMAADDSGNTRLLLTAQSAGDVTGNWSVTVDHSGSATPGNIVYTQSVITEGRAASTEFASTYIFVVDDTTYNGTFSNNEIRSAALTRLAGEFSSIADWSASVSGNDLVLTRDVSGSFSGTLPTLAIIQGTGGSLTESVTASSAGSDSTSTGTLSTLTVVTPYGDAVIQMTSGSNPTSVAAQIRQGILSSLPIYSEISSSGNIATIADPNSGSVSDITMSYTTTGTDHTAVTPTISIVQGVSGTTTGILTSFSIVTPKGTYTGSFPTGIFADEQASHIASFINTNHSADYTAVATGDTVRLTSTTTGDAVDITMTITTNGTNQTATQPTLVVVQHGNTAVKNTEDSITINLNASTSITVEFDSGSDLDSVADQIVGTTISNILIKEDNEFNIGNDALASGHKRIVWEYDTTGVVADNTGSAVSITTGNTLGDISVSNFKTEQQGRIYSRTGIATVGTIAFDTSISASPIIIEFSSIADANNQTQEMYQKIFETGGIGATATYRSGSDILTIEQTSGHVTDLTVTYSTNGTNQTATAPTVTVQRQGADATAPISVWTTPTAANNNGTPGSDGATPIFERFYTTSSGRAEQVGTPTTPGTGVTWVEITLASATYPSSAVWVATRYTIGTTVYAWNVFPVSSGKFGFPIVNYDITRSSPPIPTLGDAQWIIDVLAGVTAHTGDSYTNQRELGYGTSVVINYNVDGFSKTIGGKFTLVSGVDTWLTPTAIITDDLIVTGDISSDKLKTNTFQTNTALITGIVNGVNAGTTTIDGGNITAVSIKAEAMDVDSLSSMSANLGEIISTTDDGTVVRNDKGTGIYDENDLLVVAMGDIDYWLTRSI